MYISGVHSVQEMFNLYECHCVETNRLPLKLHVYRDIFNYEFNIGFKLPVTNTCKVCDAFSAQNDENNPVKTEHLSKVDAAKKQYEADIESSKGEDSDVVVLTADLQQALPTPHIPTETVFYLQQLCTYNFGMHVCHIGEAFMCASRGSNEIVLVFSRPSLHLLMDDVISLSGQIRVQDKIRISLLYLCGFIW